MITEAWFHSALEAAYDARDAQIAQLRRDARLDAVGRILARLALTVAALGAMGFYDWWWRLACLEMAKLLPPLPTGA